MRDVGLYRSTTQDVKTCMHICSIVDKFMENILGRQPVFIGNSLAVFAQYIPGSITVPLSGLSNTKVDEDGRAKILKSLGAVDFKRPIAIFDYVSGGNTLLTVVKAIRKDYPESEIHVVYVADLGPNWKFEQSMKPLSTSTTCIRLDEGEQDVCDILSDSHTRLVPNTRVGREPDHKNVGTLEDVLRECGERMGETTRSSQLWDA